MRKQKHLTRALPCSLPVESVTRKPVCKNRGERGRVVCTSRCLISAGYCVRSTANPMEGVASKEDHSFVEGVADALTRLSDSMVQQAQLLTLLQTSRDAVLEELHDTRRSLEVARSQLRAARSSEAHARAETSILRRELDSVTKSAPVGGIHRQIDAADLSRPFSPLRAANPRSSHTIVASSPVLPPAGRPTSAMRLRNRARQRHGAFATASQGASPPPTTRPVSALAAIRAHSSSGQSRAGLSYLHRMQLQNGLPPQPSAAAKAAAVSTGFGRARPSTAGRHQ
jgi:hypothetical protein